MKKIAIYGQYLHNGSYETVRHIIEALREQSCDVRIELEFSQLLKDLQLEESLETFEQLDKSYDLLISIGGDGTILRAVTYIGRLNIPILGINTGRLGFLATVQQDEINRVVRHVMSGNYKLSKRSLITASSAHCEHHLPPDNFALNQVTVSRINTTSMIQLETHLNGELRTSYLTIVSRRQQMKQ